MIPRRSWKRRNSGTGWNMGVVRSFGDGLRGWKDEDREVRCPVRTQQSANRRVEMEDRGKVKVKKTPYWKTVFFFLNEFVCWNQEAEVTWTHLTLQQRENKGLKWMESERMWRYHIFLIVSKSRERIQRRLRLPLGTSWRLSAALSLKPVSSFWRHESLKRNHK